MAIMRATRDSPQQSWVQMMKIITKSNPNAKQKKKEAAEEHSKVYSNNKAVSIVWNSFV